MKNSSFLLRNMMQATLDMRKPKANLVQLMSQVDGIYKTVETASRVRNDDVVSKRRLSTNEIFDTDSLVPEHLKAVKRPTEAEKITTAAKTLVRARSTKKQVP